jgi:hypothetical protein
MSQVKVVLGLFVLALEIAAVQVGAVTPQDPARELTRSTNLETKVLKTQSALCMFSGLFPQ